MTAHATIPLPPIADPVSDAPPISRAKLEEIFDDRIVAEAATARDMTTRSTAA